MDTRTDRSKVTVAPTEFKLVKYDPDEIADVAADLADRIGLANPIRIVVDETTPMAGMASTIDGTSSDALITIHVESGALEDTKRFTNFNRHHAEVSLGRMLLRAHDRLRPDFADAPDDDSLSLRQEAAWNTSAERPARTTRRRHQPAAVAVQPSQPVRIHGRRRRRLRTVVVVRRFAVVGDRP